MFMFVHMWNILQRYQRIIHPKTLLHFTKIYGNFTPLLHAIQLFLTIIKFKLIRKIYKMWLILLNWRKLLKKMSILQSQDCAYDRNDVAITLKWLKEAVQAFWCPLKPITLLTPQGLTMKIKVSVTIYNY